MELLTDVIVQEQSEIIRKHNPAVAPLDVTTYKIKGKIHSIEKFGRELFYIHITLTGAPRTIVVLSKDENYVATLKVDEEFNCIARQKIRTFCAPLRFDRSSTIIES